MRASDTELVQSMLSTAGSGVFNLGLLVYGAHCTCDPEQDVIKRKDLLRITLENNDRNKSGQRSCDLSVSI